MRNTALQRDLLRAGLTIGSGAGRIACNRIPSRTVLTGSGGSRGQFGETDRTMPKLQRGRINNRTVDALPVADNEVVFWDSELQGFGVRVYRSGGKVYVVQGRSGGKSKRYTIGRHGVITAEEARRKAAMTLAAIKGGQEPELSSSGWVVGPPRKKSGLPAIDGMPNSIHRNILTSLVQRYDCRVMNNIHRAEYVECLVAEFLGTGWTLPWTNGYDWAPWDIEHVSGARLEIKQSAALQPWHVGNQTRTKSPRFDIAPRKGYWTRDGTWIEGPDRPANLYVFAWHGKERAAVADHRAPDQWRFFVVPTHRLPERQDSIGLPGLKQLTDDVGYEALRFTVDRAVAGLRLRSTGA